MMARASLIVLVRVVAVIGAVIAIDQLCVEPFRGNLLLREIELRSARAQTMEPARAKAVTAPARCTPT